MHSSHKGKLARPMELITWIKTLLVVYIVMHELVFRRHKHTECFLFILHISKQGTVLFMKITSVHQMSPQNQTPTVRVTTVFHLSHQRMSILHRNQVMIEVPWLNLYHQTSYCKVSNLSRNPCPQTQITVMFHYHLTTSIPHTGYVVTTLTRV